MRGILVVLVPGLPKLEERDVTSLTFDVGGALYSHLSFGGALSSCIAVQWACEAGMVARHSGSPGAMREAANAGFVLEWFDLSAVSGQP
jgi:enterochelin esterase-like enzyme